MNRYNKVIRNIIIATCIAFILFLAIFGIVAFFIREDLIQRFMLWGTWSLGLGSFTTAMIALIVSLTAFFKMTKTD